MTREEARKLLPIIKAFSEGAEVETKTSTGWLSTGSMSFVGSPQDYRIKPSPTYRPFANTEECWNEMLKHQPVGWLKNSKEHLLITYIYDNGINVGEVSIGYRNFDKAFHDLKFIDDTPFGVKVEEE